MATVLSKTFIISLGTVVIQVQDVLGNVSAHTIMVSGPSGVTNVDAAIATILTQVDEAAAAIQAAFQAAGWTGGS